MSHSTELRTKLVQGIQELESDLGRLRAALAALDGGSSSSKLAAEPTVRYMPGCTLSTSVTVPANGALITV